MLMRDLLELLKKIGTWDLFPKPVRRGRLLRLTPGRSPSHGIFPSSSASASPSRPMAAMPPAASTEQTGQRSSRIMACITHSAHTAPVARPGAKVHHAFPKSLLVAFAVLALAHQPSGGPGLISCRPARTCRTFALWTAELRGGSVTRGRAQAFGRRQRWQDRTARPGRGKIPSGQPCLWAPSGASRSG
jgi:hypothetical protein